MATGLSDLTKISRFGEGGRLWDFFKQTVLKMKGVLFFAYLFVCVCLFSGILIINTVGYTVT